MLFHVNHMELPSIGNSGYLQYSSADAPNRRPLLEIYLIDIGLLQRDEVLFPLQRQMDANLWASGQGSARTHRG